MMKWLLLIFTFDVSNSAIRVVDQDSRVFASEEECNLKGRELQKETKYASENLRSMSICIPESAFEE